MKTALALLVVLLSVGCRIGEPKPTYSDGYRVGNIEKFSRRGLIWKTWEGRLLLNGFDRNSDGQLVARKFHFSVTDAKVAQDIESAMTNDKPIKVHYKEDFLSQLRYDSSYFVDNVETKK